MLMDQLPSSIEAYLEEAGFSGTEILILRRLMDGEPLTIRQLGAKTGKSTGVLDQAMKKLIKKNIVKKALVNDAPKYSLDSLESVVEWMQDDMEQKREMLLRRHQNFESFVSSLESGSKRPDIEYFEGESGIKQAYIKLLNGPGEILHYLPVTTKEEDDPLRDFRVQYFRERQLRKMFSRVLAHDTELGHRYQSRDAFEYRKTVLVPEKEYPFTFEKIITGDRIACLDHAAKTACIIRYPELADVERTLFEAIWKQVQRISAEQAENPKISSSEKEEIAFSTEALSQIREFFLSKKSIITFTFFAILALATTYILSINNAEVVKSRIKERVKSIAATAALQFDEMDINQIKTINDVNKPEYAKLVHHLNRIRRENEGVKFAYIMRPTSERDTWEFVADADSINPNSKIDLNNDGEINDKDNLSLPGEKYFDNEPVNNKIELYFAKSYEPYSDKWGEFISGSAPIFDANNKPIAIIGVDIETSYWHNISSSSFWSILSFFGFFLLFVLIRLAAYNRSILSEVLELFSLHRVLTLALVGALISSAATLPLYQYSIEKKTLDARNKISSIADAGAIGFSAEMLSELNSIDDTKTIKYEKVVEMLHQMREANDEIKYAYLIRPVANSTTFSFIADADAYGHDPYSEDDTNGDGLIDGSDEVGYPGLPYDISHIDVLRERLYSTAITSKTPYADKWGFVFSGYAPIRDSSESVVALLAIDVDAIGVFAPTFIVFLPFIIFIVSCLSFVFLSQGFQFSLAYSASCFLCRKKIIYAVSLILMGIYWVLFCFYFHQKNLVREETGKRLMAISATAISQIDPRDLVKIHSPQDMRSSEYQSVFVTLNKIRDANPDIKWIYILRPTSEPKIWEFIVDADSNFFLDNGDDYNADGIIQNNEENVWPGMKYFYEKGVLDDAKVVPAYSKEVEMDQWGRYITGAAPIFSQDGLIVGVLGIDLEFD